MEIKDFNELNALYKLLMTIKSSDEFRSSEVDLFAGSPYINSILKRVRLDYIAAIRQQHGDKYIDQGLAESKFTLDSPMGIAIQTRIQNWDTSILRNLTSKTQADIISIAKGYVEPLDYETEELNKLVAVIIERLKQEIQP